TDPTLIENWPGQIRQCFEWHWTAAWAITLLMFMNGVVYDWKRYWVPRDGAFSYDSDGFLLPPANDSDRLFWPKTEVVGFDALIAKPCLVFLGEPGIGKTFAQREGARRAREARPEAKILERNLGIYA